MTHSDSRGTMIIRRAPAYATIQDAGRRGFMSSGVPRSGAMDLLTLLTVNAILGNDARAAGIEWALTGGEIEFTGPTSFAIGGAQADIARNGDPLEHYRVHRAKSGDVLTIGTITSHRFLYLGIAGGIDTPSVMESRSTYLPGGFGGLDGRRLRNGDSIPTGNSVRRHFVTDPLPLEFRPALTMDFIRVIEREAFPELHGVTWRISSASDRTGYRLAGNQVSGVASIISEPVCPGTIQIPPGGEPIVLMSDAPTIGGYRIAGVVISADIGALAQRNPGETITFATASVEAAQREWNARAEVLQRIGDWSLSSK